jgi:hypothetical protein
VALFYITLFVTSKYSAMKHKVLTQVLLNFVMSAEISPEKNRQDDGEKETSSTFKRK